MKAKILVQAGAYVNLVELVSFMAVKIGKPLSNSEIGRRIKDGAVYINNERKIDYMEDIACGDKHVVVKWGKRGNYKVLAPSPWVEREIDILEMKEDGTFTCTAQSLMEAILGKEEA
jgi:hypothetical protein